MLNSHKITALNMTISLHYHYAERIMAIREGINESDFQSQLGSPFNHLDINCDNILA